VQFEFLVWLTSTTHAHLCLNIDCASVDLFINRLFSSKCIPTFLWTDHRLLKHIHELFRDCDNSIMSVATKLKSELRRYFSAPGESRQLFDGPNSDISFLIHTYFMTCINHRRIHIIT